MEPRKETMESCQQNVSSRSIRDVDFRLRPHKLRKKKKPEFSKREIFPRRLIKIMWQNKGQHRLSASYMLATAPSGFMYINSPP